MRAFRFMIGVLLLSLDAATALAADVPAADVQTVLASWKERAQQRPAIELQWRRGPRSDSDRFARSDAEWVVADQTGDNAAEATLRIDGNRYIYTGRRSAAGPHGYDAAQVKSITASIGTAYPERLGAPYTRALLNHFADATAEQRQSQQFLRSFDGDQLRDFWTADGDAYPRAVLYTLPEYGSADWACFCLEQDPNEQLQTLELVAALLAICPLHAALGIRTEHLRIIGTASIDGAPCTVLSESSAISDAATRTLFVDQERCVVRRYIGGASAAGVQIDIAYFDDVADGTVPKSWIVLKFATADRPVQQYVRAIVAKCAIAGSLPDAQLTSELQAGTWVVDQPEQQSYLIRERGARRVITPEELRWLPTY
ncbi:MAG: hypothetical protein JNG89_15780, partial [Planctomycetaceae bacterium]|nr:hypothetical protein [Planctomycetaceae bacterium]